MKHARIAFKEKLIPLYTDSSRKELQRYNSNFKVPVLVDGDFTVWDSLAILEYVSEQYLDSKGWPQDAKARALARSISAEIHSSFTSLRTELPMNCRKNISNVKLSDNAQKDIERITDIWRRCRAEYGAGGEWLFGQFSIADAMYAPVALRFAGYSIPLSGMEASYVQGILKLPNIIEWIEAGKQEKEVLEQYEVETTSGNTE